MESAPVSFPELSTASKRLFAELTETYMRRYAYAQELGQSNGLNLHQWIEKNKYCKAAADPQEKTN